MLKVPNHQVRVCRAENYYCACAGSAKTLVIGRHNPRMLILRAIIRDLEERRFIIPILTDKWRELMSLSKQVHRYRRALLGKHRGRGIRPEDEETAERLEREYKARIQEEKG